MSKAVILAILILIISAAAQDKTRSRRERYKANADPVATPAPIPTPGALVANAGPDMIAYAGEPLRLDGTASSGSIATARWATGDGFVIDSILKAPHVYLAPGTYTATLTIADTSGNVSSDIAVFTVRAIGAANSQTLTDTGDPELNKQIFQSALNAAALNPDESEIVVPAGMSINDTIYMPARNPAWGTYVTVRSSLSAEIPHGVRAGRADRSKMFRIIARAAGGGVENYAILIREGTSYFRFVGMDVVRTGGFKNDIIGVVYSGVVRPSHMIFDRVVLDGNGTDTVRAFAPNGEYFSLLNSSIFDIKAVGNESKAIGMWSGKGGLAVINNYIEAASINTLIGGAYTSKENMIDGIVFRGNHSWKNPDWVVADGMGKGYAVKNLFELKAALNVVAEGNTFENNWVDGQSGPSILFTVRGDGQPLNTVSNVSFRRNMVLNVKSGVNILPSDNEGISSEICNVFVEDNAFIGIGDRVLILLPQLTGAGRNIHFKHNTVRMRPSAGSLMVMDGTPGMQVFIESNDFGYAGEYGVYGSGVGEGIAALQFYLTPDSTFRRNLISFEGRSYSMTLSAAMRKYPLETYFSFTAADSYNPDGTPYRFIVGTDGQVVGN